MKKLLIGILVPVVILVGGAATLYFLVSDYGKPTYQKTSLTAQDVTGYNLATAFSDTKSSKKISYQMKQDDFNQILALSMDSLDSQAKNYLNGVELKIDGDTYHILVYAKASIISSTIDVSCSFAEDDSSYYLNIQNVKVGHLSGLTSIVMNVLKQVSFDTLFSSLGIHMKADLGNKRFVYAKKDAKGDLSSLLSSQSGNGLVSSVLGNFFEMDLLSLKFTSGLTAEIDLEPLNTNAAFCSKGNMLKDSDMDLEGQKEKVKTLLEKNIIDMDGNHPQTVFEYLIRGYDSLSSEKKAYIDSVSLSEVGISDSFRKLYRGYQPKETDVTKTVLDSALNGNLVSDDGILIKEDVLNDYLKSQGLLGYGYLMPYHFDDEYILNYITLDNCYFNMLERDGKEEMDMVLGISINGYETSIVFENRKSESLSYGMKLKNENIYFGTKNVNDDLKNQLYTLVKDNLPENDFLSFDGKGNFIVNFEGSLKPYLDTLSLLGKQLTFTSSVEGKSLDDINAGLRLKGSL